ncbi:MAG: lytic transglycosylase domain-containing protein [Nannocystaceae bacterium]|nr:lytic transglycosylase domain-containing protein [Myxococcales bacterium]
MLRACLRWGVGLVVVTVGAAEARAGPATYRRHTDARGVVHITNVETAREDPWAHVSEVPGSAGDTPGSGPAEDEHRDPLAGVSGDPSRFDDAIREAALLYRLPEALLRAVIHTESRYNPNAVSPVGAMGLTQLMPATARYLGVAEPFDPSQNIFGGARYLRLLANMFNGDMILVLASYYAGAGAVRKHGGVPRHPGIRRYVKAVLRRYYAYERQAQRLHADSARRILDEPASP